MRELATYHRDMELIIPDPIKLLESFHIETVKAGDIHVNIYINGQEIPRPIKVAASELSKDVVLDDYLVRKVTGEWDVTVTWRIAGENLSTSLQDIANVRFLPEPRTPGL